MTRTAALAQRLWSALRATDHKVIAKRFLWTGLAALLFGGLLAMVIRWQWAAPGTPIPGLGFVLRASGGALTPAAYTRVFTTHGLVMIFFAITPILVGAFGTFLVPLLVGAREMAFPRLSAASYGAYLVSFGVLIGSFFVELGTASTGWTSYPPLSTQVGTPGVGQTLVLWALLLNGASTVMGGINTLATVLAGRAPGMTWFRLPLTVWGLFLTAVLNVLFVPVLLVAVLLLIFDRSYGTQFFIAGAAAVRGGGDPILYQHLFWIFGHPEVYILILPAWGIVGDVLAFFARKPHFGYRMTALSMVAITALSGTVYAHHMYTSGLSPVLGKTFMALTLVISLPAEVMTLNWLLTLWGGAIRLTSPMLFALGTVLVFSFGGLTGLYLGAVGTDLYLHDTLFVVGHFHLTMAAATFLASFTALHFWFPKLFGRQLNERLAKWHFGFTFVLLVLVFTGQLIAGYAGQPRRLFDPYQYDFVQRLLTLNKLTSLAAFALLTVQGLFVFNLVRTLWRGVPAAQNPWEVGTLEWTHCASPPAGRNFDVIPTVLRGPHAFQGKVWLGQAEELP